MASFYLGTTPVYNIGIIGSGIIQSYVFTFSDGTTHEAQAMLDGIDNIGFTDMYIEGKRIEKITHGGTGETIWVAPIVIEMPTYSGSLTYTGTAQNPAWQNYNSEALEISGDLSGVNAGEYITTFTPKDGYCWLDGSRSAITLEWSIGKAAGGITLSSDSVVLNPDTLTTTVTVTRLGDGTISAVSNNTGVATASVSGTTITINNVNETTGVATITVSVAEGSNHLAASATLSVDAQFIQYITAIPSQSGTLTYTGSSLTPSWSNYDNSKLTIGGKTSSTNAGTYTATFTPKSGYAWSDGSTTAKSVNWTIAKAAGSLSISPTSMTFNSAATLSKTITVTRTGDGKISAVSNNTSVATVSVSGNTVTVTSKKVNGSATITVSVAAGTNHNAPNNKTCSVTASFTYYLEYETATTITKMASQSYDFYQDISINPSTGSMTIMGGEYMTLGDWYDGEFDDGDTYRDFYKVILMDGYYYRITSYSSASYYITLTVQRAIIAVQ